MNIREPFAAIAALVFALTLGSDAALAQAAPLAKRPTVGGKPLVHAKPSAPMGCKFVGSVKGTKLWAGDCTAASELRTQPPPKTILRQRRCPKARRLLRRA